MYNRIKTACEYLSALSRFEPYIAIVLGSGLGEYANRVKIKYEFKYEDIPGFPVSTAPGHAGRLLFAEHFNVPIAIFCGRFHVYEGYDASETVLPLRTILCMGAKYVLLTNAVGAINKDFNAGELMIVTDHINFSGYNVLKGKNLEELGDRFPDMSYAYNTRLNNILEKIGNEEKIILRKGIYAYMPGPSYETPAEIKALRILGADVVGMSTVHEVTACAHAKIETACLSCISNLAAGVAQHALSSEDVINAGKKAAGKMGILIDRFIKCV